MIPDWKVWTVILGLGLATYVIRASFFVLLAGRQVPPVLVRILSFVPVTVMPAIVVSMLIDRGSGTLRIEEALAVLATLVTGLATRNLLAGIIAGAAGFALASLLMG